MFFRKKKTPTGQVLQLLESYRNAEGKSRSRIVVSLGNASIDPEHYHLIGKLVQNRLYGFQELSLVNHPESITHWVDYIKRRIENDGKWHPLEKLDDTAAQATSNPNDEVTTLDGVIVDKVTHGTHRELGPSLVGLHAWNALGIDKELQGLGFNALQRKTAAASVINRLVDPVSDHGLQGWLDTCALPEILGQEICGSSDDRFYRVSDKLYAKSRELECFISQRQKELFNLDRTVLLYDLTNTHFEGLCKKNKKARYGKNKQKRSDCPQIVVGMVFDREGFEVTHKIFEGNQSDAKSLTMMIDALEAQVKDTSPQLALLAKPLVIVDAGIGTNANLKLLREKGYSYLVNDRRRQRTHYSNKFEQDDIFNVVANREGKLPVRVNAFIEEWDEEVDTDGTKEKVTYKETVVLCKSEGRAQKETAMLSAAEERFVAATKKLATRMENATLTNNDKILQAIGKLKAQHPKVQRYYTISTTEHSSNKNRLTLIYKRNDEAIDDATALNGCYVLRTDQTNLSGDDLWHLYISLTRAEQGFKALKSDLGLRPNFHQKQLRVEAHVFITILAYQLMSYILRTLERSGDYRSWDTLKRVLSTHSYATIALPTKSGKVYRIRKPGEPDQMQRQIYNTLGIDWRILPKSRTVIDTKSVATL